MDKVLDNTNGFHFTIVDNYILEAKQLIGMEQIIYIHLKKYANSNGKCFPGIETMAENLSCTPNTIRKYLKSLKTKGYIDIEHRYEGNEQQSNLYTLLPYPEYREEQQTKEETSGAESQKEIIGIGKVLKTYQSNINPVYGSMEREKLLKWYENFNDNAEIIIKAIEIAIEQNVRKIKYIDSILIDWHQQGIKTLDQAESYTKQRTKAKEDKQDAIGSSTRKNNTKGQGKWSGYRPPKPKHTGETDSSDII